MILLDRQKRSKTRNKTKTNQRSFNCYFDYCLSCNWVFCRLCFKKNVIVKNTNDSSIINEVYDTLDKYWVKYE